MSAKSLATRVALRHMDRMAKINTTSGVGQTAEEMLLDLLGMLGIPHSIVGHRGRLAATAPGGEPVHQPLNRILLSRRNAHDSSSPVDLHKETISLCVIVVVQGKRQVAGRKRSRCRHAAGSRAFFE